MNNTMMGKHPSFLINYYKNIETIEENLAKYNEYIKNKNPNDLYWASWVPYREAGLALDCITFSKSLI